MTSTQRKTPALTQEDARVAAAGGEFTTWQACRVEGCSHFPYRYGHCRGHYFAILRAKKKAAESSSSTARSE